MVKTSMPSSGPRVVHVRRDGYDVYIGRPSKLIPPSKPDADGRWGNPFRIGPDGSRAEVIAKFRAWLKGEIVVPGRTPPSREEIRRALKGKVLGCWCAPQACHGDVYLEIANGED